MLRNHCPWSRRCFAARHILTASCLMAAMVSTARSQVYRSPIVVTPASRPTPFDANGTAPFYPSQIQSAYGVDVLQQSGTAAGAINNGAGQTIAIVDAYHYPNALSTLNTFCSKYGLPQFNQGGASPTFSQLNESGGTALPGVDPAGPYNLNGNWELEEALDIEWAHVMAPMANIILYESKNDDSDGQPHLENAVVTAKNNANVSVISLSWGGGEFSAETIDSQFGDPVYKTPAGRLAAKQGVTFVASTGDDPVASSYPAMSPNVVAVGGTNLSLTTSDSYYVETAWSGASGGTSSFEARPSYQSTVKVGSASLNKRGTPDLSMDADPNSGVNVYDSYNGGWYTYVGGTSLSAPCFAGLVADADEIRSVAGNGTLDGLTQTLPALYSLPDSDFHDIILGSNAFPALAGYDLATGLGTPQANLLVSDLANFGVVVPEPSTLALLAAGTIALLVVARRRKPA